MVKYEPLLNATHNIPGERRVLALAERFGISLQEYLEDGYDIDQLDGIRYALEIGVDIKPYLDHNYRGACIKEIAIGINEGLDVSTYSDLKYTWRKMREIRLGLEQNLDVSKYLDPLYSCWQMREIRLGLKSNLDVSNYDSFMYTAKEMRKRRLMLKSRKNAPILSSNWKVMGDEDYDLYISPDGLKAYLNWHCRHAVANVDMLEKILKENGIIYGVLHKALEVLAHKYQTITSETERDRIVLVARGKTPQDGKDGYYEWNFQTGRKLIPTLKKDGTIDFDALGGFNFVKKGQVLATYHFAESASEGINVLGKIIPAKIGKEKPILNGSGFEILSDFKTYVASVDGHVSLKNKAMVVTEMLVLDQLTNACSSLKYDGDVYIQGNIEGPVSIEIGGNLVVDGFIQGATIRCGGNMILKSGINNSGEDTDLNAEGFVISRYFEYVTLHAKGNIYFGTSLNSNLSSYGEIVSFGDKGGIVGGHSYSEKGFCISNIGNTAGIHTMLSIGSNDEIHELRVAAETESKELKTELKHLVSIRNQVNYRQSVMKGTAEEMLPRIEHSISEKDRQLMEANQRMEDVIKRDKRALQSKIIVEQQVYENVQIHYLNHVVTAVPSNRVEIRITGDGNLMEKQVCS